MAGWIDLGITTTSGNIGIVIAFLAGIIAFFSPCILPIIPAYIGYFSGISIDEIAQKKSSTAYRQTLMKNALLFVLGFTIIFVLLGLAAGSVSRFLVVNKEFFQRIGGLLLILLGLMLMEFFKKPWLYKQARLTIVHTKLKKYRGTQSFLTDLTFGFAWTPCIGPVLATILFYATWDGDSTRGAVLLLVFALGIALPFLAIAWGIQRSLTVIHRINRYLPFIQKIAGGIILLTGILLITNKFNPIITFFVRLWTPLI